MELQVLVIWRFFEKRSHILFGAVPFSHFKALVGLGNQGLMLIKGFFGGRLLHVPASPHKQDDDTYDNRDQILQSLTAISLEGFFPLPAFL